MALSMEPIPAMNPHGMKMRFPPLFPIWETALTVPHLKEEEEAGAFPTALESNVVMMGVAEFAENALQDFTAPTINALKTGAFPTVPAKHVETMDVAVYAEPAPWDKLAPGKDNATPIA